MSSETIAQQQANGFDTTNLHGQNSCRKLMSEQTLQELLTLMRRMYMAAREGQWDRVNELDTMRNTIFDSLDHTGCSATSVTRAAISEIIELDQAVLSLADHSMSQIAAQSAN